MYETQGFPASPDVGRDVPSARHLLSKIHEHSPQAVPELLGELHAKVDVLGKQLEELEQRLGFVLRPATPTSNADPNGLKPPASLRSTMADRIDEIHNKVCKLSHRIQDIQSRVDA